MATHTIRLKNKTSNEELKFHVVAKNASEALGKIRQGKEKISVESGTTKGGKTKTSMKPFFPEGQWSITDMFKPGIEFPEVVGMSI